MKRIEHNCKVTIRLGISQYKRNDDNDTIFKRVDNALYKAKGNGRNRIEMEIETENSINI